MYCVARMFRFTALSLRFNRWKAVYCDKRAVQYIIYVRIQFVILHPLKNPYNIPNTDRMVRPGLGQAIQFRIRLLSGFNNTERTTIEIKLSMPVPL